MNPPSWLRLGAHGQLGLTLHIQPGAKTTQIAGLHGEALKIRLAAPPVDGKANAALIAFLADRLDLPKHAVVLQSGQSSRQKIICIQGCTPDQLLKALLPETGALC